MTNSIEDDDNFKNLIKKFLEDVQSGAIKDNNQFYKDSVPDDTPQKKIDCPHELLFTISATAMEQNDKGEAVSTREICTKNYHIPVPIDKDYNKFMTTFFEYLEAKLLESVNHAYNNEESNNG
jgi:hypothetical protein